MVFKKKHTTTEATQQEQKTEPITTENTPKVENNIQTVSNSPTSIVTNNNNDDRDMIIRKKRAYKIFLRLIKENKYTSAYATAKMLHIQPLTIAKWLQTKQAIEAMNSKVSEYVAKIEASPDWKAQAYLFDKIMPTEDKTSVAIQINMPSLADDKGQILAL